MIAIDRENSKGLWAYKLLDGNEIKVIEEGLKNKGEINHLYVIKNKLDDSLYIFGGNSKESYKNYIGFLTTEDELKIHSKDQNSKSGWDWIIIEIGCLKSDNKFFSRIYSGMKNEKSGLGVNPNSNIEKLISNS
mgnify:CR=1 FL=1